MFLTHHSRDESILDKVVTQAKQLFNKSNPTALEVDTDFVNNIVDKIQFDPITYESQNRLELRRAMESKKDDIEEGSTQDYESLIVLDDTVEDEQQNEKDTVKAHSENM
jgi:hypothetical protein